MLLACIIHTVKSGSQLGMGRDTYILAHAPPPPHMVLLRMGSGSIVRERYSRFMPEGNLSEIKFKNIMMSCYIAFGMRNGYVCLQMR